MKTDHPWLESALNRLSTAGRIRTVQSVGGGCISPAWKVQNQSSGNDYFIKQNHIDFLDNFHAESDGLRSLSIAAQSVEGVEVPKVLFVGEVEGKSCLVLKWIDSAADPVDEFQYGRAIAKIHVSGGTEDRSIGYSRDNYLGATRQINTLPITKGPQGWIDFVGQQRLGFQIAMAKDGGVASRGLIEAVETTIRGLPCLLEGRRDEIALLHGDLWSGNVLFDVDGNVVLIDPAVYRGCPEAEFGMLKLFDGVGPAFDEGYQSVVMFPEGWQRRVDVYVLYHLLNHLNLFGASYLKQCERLATRLARTS